MKHEGLACAVLLERTQTDMKSAQRERERERERERKRERERENMEGTRDYFLTAALNLALGLTQCPIQWVPGVKRPKCEADHPPSSSADVENGVGDLHSPYVFMKRC
jgi:hypothetical protein